MSATMSSQFLEPTLPMLRMEKPVPSWQAASAAAIFMGCCSNMSLPCRSPVMAVPAKEIMATTAPIRRERIQTAWSARSRPGMSDSPGTTLPSAPIVSIPSWRRRHRWYQAMPSRKRAGDGQRAEDGVRDGDEGGVVGEDRPGVGHHRTAVDHLNTHRVLHPAVRHDDEVGGEDRPDHGDPEAGQVDGRLELLPAEDPEAQERGLHEEREQRFHGQRRPEHVAHEAAVFAPRHAELELLHNAGGDAHDEVDQEELAPELGHPEVFRLAGAVPHRLDHGDHQAKANRERHHHEVVDGGDSELPACDFQGVQGSPYFARRATSTSRRKILLPSVEHFGGSLHPRVPRCATARNGGAAGRSAAPAGARQTSAAWPQPGAQCGHSPTSARRVVRRRPGVRRGARHARAGQFYFM